MGSIRKRGSGYLYFDFKYMGVRCREYTALKDTVTNRRKMKKVLERIEAEILLGTFDYNAYFPNSKQALKFMPEDEVARNTPLFKDFAWEWFDEMLVSWRESHADSVRSTMKSHVIKRFGDMKVSDITKPDILKFRSSLAKAPGRNNKEGLTSRRINQIMLVVSMIMNEAADRFNFNTPYRGIKRLKIQRVDIEPFTINEVNLILANIRPEFRDYFLARFFTGMRTGEVDGLKWKYVDFNRQQILIRETIVKGKMTYTKTDGSQREIIMSTPVMEALRRQFDITAESSEFVFCTNKGTPHEHNNIRKRVWYPLLRHLDLTKRRPYQTRHTAATLWLAAGENPEWIARQMGHSSTEMLFRVYSRYVPNLTRQDGSAIERLLQANQMGGAA